MTTKQASKIDTSLLSEVQVGRQPILDREKNTYGYELLYRDSKSLSPAHIDGDKARQT